MEEENPKVPNECLCGKIVPSDSMVNLQCRRCHQYFHTDCYLIPDASQRFICFKCRIELNDPFYALDYQLAQPTLYQNYSTIEIEFFMKATEFDLLSSVSPFYSVMIVCTKLEQDGNSYIEWPADNMQLIINNKVAKYDPLRHALVSNHVNIGKNYVEISPAPGTPTKPIIIAVYLARKIDLNKVTELLVIEHRLDMEEAKLNYINRSQGDIEVNAPYLIKDPLTMTMIQIPARGKTCAHLENFDFKNWLQFNESLLTLKRWSCPICGKFINIDKLLVDEFFFSILLQIRFRYEDRETQKYEEKKQTDPNAQMPTEQEIQEMIEDEISEVYIDRDGEWYTPDEHKSKFFEQNPVKSHERKREKKDTTKMDIEAGNKTPPIKPQEVTIQEAMDCFEDLKAQYAYMKEPERILDNIGIKMREMNIFRCYSASKMYQFLQKTDRLTFSQSTVFERMTDILLAKLPEDIIEEKIYGKYHNAIRFIFAWATSASQIVDIALQMASSGKKFEIDLPLALECLLAMAYHMQKKIIPLDLPKQNLSFVYGRLLKIMLKKIDCYELGYIDSVMGLMRDCIPAFFIPKYYPKTNMAVELKKDIEYAAQFVAELISDIPEQDITAFFTNAYLYPTEPLKDFEDIHVKIFILFFKAVLSIIPKELEKEKLFNQYDKLGYFRQYCVQKDISFELLNEAIFK